MDLIKLQQAFKILCHLGFNISALFIGFCWGHQNRRGILFYSTKTEQKHRRRNLTLTVDVSKREFMFCTKENPLLQFGISNEICFIAMTSFLN